MRSPVFKRLQERNTSAFFNYMTASVSKFTIKPPEFSDFNTNFPLLGPLNARSKNIDMALRSSSREHKRASSRGAISLVGGSEKENNPIAKLTTLGDSKVG